MSQRHQCAGASQLTVMAKGLGSLIFNSKVMRSIPTIDNRSLNWDCITYMSSDWYYSGNIVNVRTVYKKTVDLNRTVLMELKQVKNPSFIQSSYRQTLGFIKLFCFGLNSQNRYFFDHLWAQGFENSSWTNFLPLKN